MIHSSSSDEEFKNLKLKNKHLIQNESDEEEIGNSKKVDNVIELDKEFNKQFKNVNLDEDDFTKENQKFEINDKEIGNNNKNEINLEKEVKISENTPIQESSFENKNHNTFNSRSGVNIGEHSTLEYNPTDFIASSQMGFKSPKDHNKKDRGGFATMNNDKQFNYGFQNNNEDRNERNYNKDRNFNNDRNNNNDRNYNDRNNNNDRNYKDRNYNNDRNYNYDRNNNNDRNYNSERNERNYMSDRNERNQDGEENNFNRFSNRGFRPRGNNNRGGRNQYGNSFNKKPYIGRMEIYSENRRGHIDDYQFYRDNKEIIEEILKNFNCLDENLVIETLKIVINGPTLVVFELLNEFSRRNFINKNKYENLISKKCIYGEVSIFQTHERDILNTHEYMMKSYKTQPHTENGDILSKKENYLNSSDRRREIRKDINGYYNYLPILCETHKNSDEAFDECKFAHNNNEINYHSLLYHTKLCCKKNCSEKMCPNSHDLGEDFRRIYDYRKKEIIELTIKLEKCSLLKDHLTNYMQLFSIPTAFSLDTFKILPCKLPGYCGVDQHLCLNYHDEKERRRPPKLFKLANEICQYAQPSKDSEFFPHLCPKGDHCEKFHTRYELLYHSDNFRKIKVCTRATQRGRCKFFLTCYGIHPTDQDKHSNNYSNINNTNEEIEKNFVKIDEYNKLNNQINTIKKMLSCRFCEQFTLKLFQTKCNHILCENCLKEILIQEVKLCCVCKTLIQKGSMTTIDLSKNKNDKK